MLKKKCIIIFACVFFVLASWSQNPSADSLPAVPDPGLAIDTSMDYDNILDEFVDFVDSLLAPRSYLLTSVSFAGSYFNYKTRNNADLFVRKRIVFTPTLGYYHKSGPGITFSGNLVNDGNRRRMYQYAITPSFDFIQSLKAIGGFSYTRYFTKDSLTFYTSPLQNEISAYFLWRKPWLQTGLSANYGWGSRSDLQKRERYIQLLNTRRFGTIITTINTQESVADFSLTASLRHTFYWLNLSSNNDYIKLTPMLTFTAGTQKYGFNQTTGTYAVALNTGDVKYNTGNVNLDNKLKFQPLSMTLYLRPEYLIGKFFLQPQFILDYYFPGDDKKLTSLFSLNMGFMF